MEYITELQIRMKESDFELMEDNSSHWRESYEVFIVNALNKIEPDCISFKQYQSRLIIEKTDSIAVYSICCPWCLRINDYSKVETLKHSVKT